MNQASGVAQVRVAHVRAELAALRAAAERASRALTRVARPADERWHPQTVAKVALLAFLFLMI